MRNRAETGGLAFSRGRRGTKLLLLQGVHSYFGHVARALRNGWAAVSAGREPRRFRRTPSGRARRLWAGVPVCHTAARSEPASADASLLSLAKYRVVRVDEKSGSRAAALQIGTLQYYAGLSGSQFPIPTRSDSFAASCVRCIFLAGERCSISG